MGNSQNPEKAFKTEPFKVQDTQELNYSSYMFGDDMLLNMKKEREFLIASKMYHNSKNRDFDPRKSNYMSNYDNMQKSNKRRGIVIPKSPMASSRIKSRIE